jgi:hypothetical protein
MFHISITGLESKEGIRKYGTLTHYYKQYYTYEGVECGGLWFPLHSHES